MLVKRHQLFVKETNESFQYNEKYTTAHTVWELAKEILGDEIEIQENLYAVYFNGSMTAIGYAHISKGGIDSTIIPPVVIFKYAIDLLATGFIIFHNHPSGNLNPSNFDKGFSSELLKAGKLLNIKVIDNLIVTKNGFYSIDQDLKHETTAKEEVNEPI